MVTAGASDDSCLFKRMSLLFVRVKGNGTNSQCNNNTNEKNKSKPIHFYSPPFKKVPVIKNNINKMVPTITESNENFSGAILVTTTATKTACAKFKQTFDRPSLWRLLISMCSSVAKLCGFVKRKVSRCLRCYCKDRVLL